MIQLSFEAYYKLTQKCIFISDIFDDDKKNKKPKYEEKLGGNNNNEINSSNLNNIDIKLKKTENEYSKRKAKLAVINSRKSDNADVIDSLDNTSIYVLKQYQKSIDCNDNLMDIDEQYINSEICDKHSDKNNKDLNENAQIDNINLIEYKEYNIIKIVLKDIEMLARISSSIQRYIINDESKNGYLKCHGIQNGGLIYSTDGDWFKNILCSNFNIECKNGTIDQLKMKVHLNSFLNVKDILNALEINNIGLRANSWSVLEEGESYFTVSLDCDSFKIICKERFSLFAGIDTAAFTVVL